MTVFFLLSLWLPLAANAETPPLDEGALEEVGVEEEGAVEEIGAVEDEEAAEEEAASELPPLTLEEVWAGLPDEQLLQQAIDRRALGDIEGARGRLRVLDERGTLPALSLYHLAICDELEEDYAAAQAGYQTITLAWPHLPLARDARYRRAIVLEDMDLHREASKEIKLLEKAGGWEPTDAMSMELVRGAAEVRAGRTRRGVRRIQRVLDQLEGSDQLTWARARARMALAEAQLEAAREVAIRNDRKAARRLERRAHLLTAAQDQVIAIARLGEPEYALQGLLALGDGFLALHDDLLAAPPPSRLTEDQVEVYKRSLREQVDVLEVKAWRFYDEGVGLATRLRWQGSIAEQLAARRDALDPAL